MPRSKSRNLAPIPLSYRVICRSSEQLGAAQRRSVLLSFFPLSSSLVTWSGSGIGKTKWNVGTTCKMISLDLSSPVPKGYKPPCPSIIFFRILIDPFVGMNLWLSFPFPFPRSCQYCSYVISKPEAASGGSGNDRVWPRANIGASLQCNTDIMRRRTWQMYRVWNWGLGFVKICWYHSSALPGQGRVNGITTANSRTLTPRSLSMQMYHHQVGITVTLLSVLHVIRNTNCMMQAQGNKPYA